MAAKRKKTGSTRRTQKICNSCGVENALNAQKCKSCGSKKFAPNWVTAKHPVIGVQNDQKTIAAVPAVTVRRRKELSNWRIALGNDLGIPPINKIPEMIRRHIGSGVVKVSV
jgi:ribosomal protein L40E